MAKLGSIGKKLDLLIKQGSTFGEYIIKSYSKDKYGRYLAEIFNDSNECLNDLLLETGLAERYV